MTTNSHSRPSAACALSTAHGVGLGAILAGARRQAERGDVIEEAAQRCAGGAIHILLGDIEERGDGIEVTVGLCARCAAAFAGRQPAPLQTGAVPCLPERVARIPARGRGASRSGQHRAHPPQRTGEFGGEPICVPRLALQRIDEQVAEFAGRLSYRPAGAAPAAAAAATPGRPGRSARSAAKAPAHRRVRRAVASRTVSRACTAGWSASGALGIGRSTGTPAVARVRASADPSRGTDRTITAIWDHGTPSTRCARRNASAINADSACGEAAMRTVSEPRPARRRRQRGERRRHPEAVERFRVMARATAGAQRRDSVRMSAGSSPRSSAGSAPR